MDQTPKEARGEGIKGWEEEGERPEDPALDPQGGGAWGGWESSRPR